MHGGVGQLYLQESDQTTKFVKLLIKDGNISIGKFTLLTNFKIFVTPTKKFVDKICWYIKYTFTKNSSVKQARIFASIFPLFP